MDFHTKLPRNKKEFALFIIVISIISVNSIAPLITFFEIGFTLNTWNEVLKVIPVLWLTVIVFVLITYHPAEFLTKKIINEEDSFKSVITINILCTVFILSIILTIVGTWIGSRHISTEPIIHFFYKWPRNFTIALGIELLIAQPIARLVMVKYHKYIDNYHC